MLPNKEIKCHHTGFTKSCRALVADGHCDMWRKLCGVPAGETAPRDIYDCIEKHAHTLRLNLIASSEQAGAATESFRNEVVGRAQARHMKLIQGNT